MDHGRCPFREELSGAREARLPAPLLSLLRRPPAPASRMTLPVPPLDEGCDLPPDAHHPPVGRTGSVRGSAPAKDPVRRGPPTPVPTAIATRRLAAPEALHIVPVGCSGSAHHPRIPPHSMPRVIYVLTKKHPEHLSGKPGGPLPKGSQPFTGERLAQGGRHRSHLKNARFNNPPCGRKADPRHCTPSAAQP